MKSMTGYGKGEAAAESCQVRAEIKTVNHRFLDLAIRAPQLLMPYEISIQREIKNWIVRGHVEVYLAYSTNELNGAVPTIDAGRVSAIAAAAEKVAGLAGCPSGLSAARILEMPDVMSLEPAPGQAELAQTLAVDAVRLACEQVCAAREDEGMALWKDVRQRADVLEDIVERIAEHEP